MQNWNDQIRKQLNNLPGFPPIPTGTPFGTPVTPLEWILGDWIQECRLRPSSVDFASLPATGNAPGDIRASLADQAWYIWDGAVWQPMGGGGGGVNSVGALAPISSTGGANPVISLNNSGVVAATYGDATNVPQIAVDAKGRITSASNVAISMPSVNVGLGNVAVGDGTSITGSTDLSFVSNVLEVNSQINVTNGGNTLTAQPASIGSDAATLTIDAGTTVQVGGVALVNISGAFTLPGVDGANGQVLTTDGAGTVSWQTPSAAPSTVDVAATAQENLLAGDLVRFVNDVGTPKAQKADATNSDARLNPVGFAVAAALAGAAVTVRVAGVADVPAALFDVAPVAADVGKRVFVSVSTLPAGKITLTAPSVSGDIVQRAGVLVDGGANPKVLVQIGDPILL